MQDGCDYGACYWLYYELIGVGVGVGVGII